jgi:hypothetical protein
VLSSLLSPLCMQKQQLITLDPCRTRLTNEQTVEETNKPFNTLIEAINWPTEPHCCKKRSMTKEPCVTHVLSGCVSSERCFYCVSPCLQRKVVL